MPGRHRKKRSFIRIGGLWGATSGAAFCIALTVIPVDLLTSAGSPTQLPNTFTAPPTLQLSIPEILPTPDLPQPEIAPQKDAQSQTTAPLRRSTTRPTTTAPQARRILSPQRTARPPASSTTTRRPTTTRRTTQSQVPQRIITTTKSRTPVTTKPQVTTIPKCGTIRGASQVIRACNQILSAFPEIKTVFGLAARPGNPTSCHPRGLALDLMVTSNALGDRIAAYVRANKAALGITTILWEVPAHYDHVHVSFDPCRT